MPAPTTSTSTSASAGVACRRRLYRPVSIRPRLYRPVRDRARGDRGSEVVGAPGALRDGGPGPGAARSATSTRTSTRWRSSCCGRGSGRWRAGSRRSRSRDDFVEYEILDQSIIVVRTDDMGVRAFQNACRHRGVQVVEGRGTCESGFTCPFHGWCYGLDGTNTFVPRRKTFAEHNLQPGDIDLAPVRCEVWGGCAWINLDDDAPPLRQCIEPFATILDAWKVESLRTEWWYACRLPVNWKLAEEAFVEQYHVVETHPAARHPRAVRAARRRRRSTRARSSTPSIHYLRAMSDGMAGMVHANDVRIAEGLRDIELPADPTLAMATWNRTLNDAVVSWHRDRGRRHPRPQRARRAGAQRADGLLLPALLRAADVQQRVVVPLPPARTGGDADGDLVAHAVPGGRASRRSPRRPSRGSATIRGGRRSPRRTSRTCRGSSRACTRRASSTCACPSGPRDTSRTSSGPSTASSPAFPYEQLLPALRAVNVNPLDRPIVDLGF